ncbi:MAG: 50S ribosome-binding protein YggL [Aeromonas sp.]
MAQRSRRLRKKLRIEEFQELAFDLSFNIPASTSEEAIDALVDAFIAQVIEPRKLAFAGSGHLAWEGMVCTQGLGKCTEEDRTAVQSWLTGQGMEAVVITELFDLWYGEPA